MGHPPFGHAGEERLDTLPARAFRHRLPPQRAVAADRRAAEPHRRGPGRNPHAHRAAGAARRSRARSSGSSTASRTSTTTSTTRSAAGLLTPDDLPRAEIDLLGETGSSRIDTLVHDLIESSERAGDIVQSEEVGAAMLALRAFMFERVYLGEHARGEHERAHATITAIFDHLVERGDSEDEIRDVRLRHDRPFRPRVRRAPLVARIKETSVREVVAASDMVEVVVGADVAAQGGRALLRPLPLPRGADAELLRQPGRQALPLLRLRQGRRRDHVRPRDREPRLRRGRRVARGAIPRHARVRGDLAAARGVAQAARPAARGARPGDILLRAAPLGDGRGRAGARVPREPRARRGGLPRVPARPLAGKRACGEGAGEGVHARRAARRRADQRARQRLLPAAADVPARRRARARRRLPGAQAARGRSAEGQVRQLARGRALPQVRDPLRPPPRADGDREAGACASSSRATRT